MNVCVYKCDRSTGRTYVLGRKEYGRLGLGKDSDDAIEPTIIPALENKKVINISCGGCVSFAVTDEGKMIRIFFNVFDRKWGTEWIFRNRYRVQLGNGHQLPIGQWQRRRCLRTNARHR